MGRDLSHIHTPLSGSYRQAQRKALTRARAMSVILAEAAAEKRAAGEALILEANKLSCDSWNERMWSQGGPAEPSPTIDQAIAAGVPWLEVLCTSCGQRISVALAKLPRRSRAISELEVILFHKKCPSGDRRPLTVLKQLAPTCQYPSQRKDP